MMGSAALYLAPLLHQASTCVDRCLSNWKIGFAALLFVEGLVFGHVVYLIKRLTSSSSSKTFSYIFHLGNSLSGGIFFAAGVLHVLPEALELMAGEHGEHGDEDGDDDDNEERWALLRQEDEDDPDHGEEGEEEHSFPWALLILMLSFYVFFFIEKILFPKLLASTAGKVKPSASDEEVGQLNEETEDDDHSLEVIEPKGFKSREFVTGLVEILGISAHSLFESMALGLSGSFSTVLNIFIATAAHRWATASAIGFKLLRTLTYPAFLALILLFSAFVPLGVGIGAAIGNLSQTSQGVLFSISAGTFIYIGAYDVLSEEFAEHRKWPLTKFAVTMLGVSSMIVVTVILNVLDIHG